MCWQTFHPRCSRRIETESEIELKLKLKVKLKPILKGEIGRNKWDQGKTLAKIVKFT
jgi:hypothetical protein